MIYFYSSPSGIELIEGDKMPVMPEFKGDYFLHYGPQKQYEAALQAAKASGIPVKDQERGEDMIIMTFDPRGSTNKPDPKIKPGEIYGPFDISYRVDEVFSHCTVGEKHYVKVAILLPESKLPDKEEQDAFLLHLIDVTACYVMEQNMYLGTPTRKELIQKARETFTITRKQ